MTWRLLSKSVMCPDSMAMVDGSGCISVSVASSDLLYQGLPGLGRRRLLLTAIVRHVVVIGHIQTEGAFVSWPWTPKLIGSWLESIIRRRRCYTRTFFWNHGF